MGWLPHALRPSPARVARSRPSERAASCELPAASLPPVGWETLTCCLEHIGAHLLQQPAADAAASAVYVHCYGGHGRAGVVAACLLGMGCGLSAADALEATQARHRAAKVGCPPISLMCGAKQLAAYGMAPGPAKALISARSALVAHVPSL